MSFASLPPELLLQIAQYLPLSDLMGLSMTSKRFRHFLNDKFLWRILAKRDFDIFIQDNRPRQLYQDFYHPYAKILGFYRLYTLFSKQLLHIRVDPSNSRQFIFRTWPLSSKDDADYSYRDVLKIVCDKEGLISARCLEKDHDGLEDPLFCFESHSGEHEVHCFNFQFHYCQDYLYFSPLGIDFNIVCCPPGKCLRTDFTHVVCCQKLLELEPRQNTSIRIVEPGIFARSKSHPNSSLLLHDDLFILSYHEDLEDGEPLLILTGLSSHQIIVCASLLLPCDLSNARQSVRTLENPNFDLDQVTKKPFTWGYHAAGYPSAYKAAYFDQHHMTFLVFFDSRTVGCFFRDGTCDLFNRFDFD